MIVRFYAKEGNFFVAASLAGDCGRSPGAGRQERERIADRARPGRPSCGRRFCFAETESEARLRIEHLKKTDAGIVAYLPRAAGSDEYVLVGAHYDHLGRGGISSLERAGEENKIHPGDAVKIGQPVEIVIERDGKRMTLTVTPEARK